ncbi:MAG: hypothetical protein ACOCPM_07295 [Bacteroidales bacterium]
MEKNVYMMIFVILIYSCSYSYLSNSSETCLPEINEEYIGNDNYVNLICMADSLYLHNRYKTMASFEILHSDNEIGSDKKIVIEMNHKVSEAVHNTDQIFILNECDSIYGKIYKSRFRDSLIMLKGEDKEGNCKQQYVIRPFKELLPFFADVASSELNGLSESWDPKVKNGAIYYISLRKNEINHGVLPPFTTPAIVVPLENKPDVHKLKKKHNFREILGVYLMANIDSENKMFKKVIIDGLLFLKPNIKKELFPSESGIYKCLDLYEKVSKCGLSPKVSVILKKYKKLNISNRLIFVKKIGLLNSCPQFLDLVYGITSIENQTDSKIDSYLTQAIFDKKIFEPRDKIVIVKLLEVQSIEIACAAFHVIIKHFPDLSKTLELDPAKFARNRDAYVRQINDNLKSQTNGN